MSFHLLHAFCHLALFQPPPTDSFDNKIIPTIIYYWKQIGDLRTTTVTTITPQLFVYTNQRWLSKSPTKVHFHFRFLFSDRRRRRWRFSFHVSVSRKRRHHLWLARYTHMPSQSIHIQFITYVYNNNVHLNLWNTLLQKSVSLLKVLDNRNVSSPKSSSNYEEDTVPESSKT